MEHDDLRGHDSADDEYLHSPDATYEHTDAHAAPIAKYMVWLAVLTVLTVVGIGVMFATMIGNRIEIGERRYPLAGVGNSAPPEPAGARLQVDPEADMQLFRNTETLRLESYGWIDEEAGIVHLPIEEAMRLTVERGLPARDASEVAPDRRPPADASGGRTAGQAP
jgi:hypothetical protein